MNRPANQDMVDGYMEGRNLDTPWPSDNRSASYHHGFKVGRAEKLGKRLGPFADVVAAAEAAMAEDEAR